MPDFIYIHGNDAEGMLSSVMDMLIVFTEPISMAMREEVLAGLPGPLRFEVPRWGRRVLHVASQEYPGVAVRLSYNDEIMAYARAQGFDVRDEGLYDRVVEGFDDEALDEEYEAFLHDMDRWLVQNHQRLPLALVLSGPLIELAAYEQGSGRWRPDVRAWLPLLRLSAEDLGEVAPIFDNMLYAAMLYAVDSLDGESMEAARALLAQIVPGFATDEHWQELCAGDP